MVFIEGSTLNLHLLNDDGMPFPSGVRLKPSLFCGLEPHAFEKRDNEVAVPEQRGANLKKQAEAQKDVRIHDGLPCGRQRLHAQGYTLPSSRIGEAHGEFVRKPGAAKKRYKGAGSGFRAQLAKMLAKEAPMAVDTLIATVLRALPEIVGVLEAGERLVEVE